MTEQLREAIRNSGLSLNQLSRDSGVTVPSISRFVNDERGLSLTAAEKLCRTLHLRLISEDKPEDN